MDSIGAEVGQKMRSAIKAKLMELDCYVDEELPDYIMVMVANRRTKSQMNEDLNLFLSSKTSTFVNWLHIVLKKLKEVTVTNPDVYKKAAKRKTSEVPPDEKISLKVKKEKSNKKVKKELQCEMPDEEKLESKEASSRSLTDDLPITVNKFAEKRKVILTDDSVEGQSTADIAEDNFDIPLLSEVTESSNEQELQDIEKKIRSVKSRLGILVESDNDDDEDRVSKNFKSETDLSSNQVEEQANSRQISILENEIIESENREAEKPTSTTNILGKDRCIEIEKEQPDESGENEIVKVMEKKYQHKRITFENDNDVESNSIRTRRDRVGDLRSRDRSPDRFRDRSPHGSPSKMVTGKKLSILERLGKRLGSPERLKKSVSSAQYRKEGFSGYNSEEHGKRSSSRDRDRTNRFLSRLGRDKRQRDGSRDRSRSGDRSLYKPRDRGGNSRNEGVFSRVGVQSKIAIVKKPPLNHVSSDEEEVKVAREVSSAIKVKPRVIPSDVAQPNKNLLLKAMAEAQRSIAQTPKVGKEVKPDALYTKKYKEKRSDPTDQRESASSKSLMEEKNRLKSVIQRSSHRMRSRLEHSSDEYHSDGEYIPKPVKNLERVVPRYTPSSKTNNDTNGDEICNDSKANSKQQFIITLDGTCSLEQTLLAEKKTSVKLRLEDKKSPSPIIFDKTSKSNEMRTRPNIPDRLPIVHPPLSVKNKERCMYWPECRQGDKCEFVHPSQNCDSFPYCKFGDKCLFLHPKCKFGTSCTKRDCPYSHNKSIMSSKLPVAAPQQNCKFFPNCTNLNCPFYHSKPCKYGKYCKNVAECTFSHSFVVNKKSLSWRSK